MNVTNMKFDEFKDIWQKISDKILNNLIDGYDNKTDIEKKALISKISKLIAQFALNIDTTNLPSTHS